MPSGISPWYTGEAGRHYFQWQRSAGEVGGRLEARKFAPHLAAGDAVVDFGCGGGFMLHALQAGQKVGIEPNAAAREAAVARGLRALPSVTDLEDEWADVVVSNHVLEHTLSPIDELRELRRVLKPAGRLVLWLPLDDWRTQRSPRPADVNHHLFTWTPVLLTNLLIEAGFAVGECRVVTRAWPPAVKVFGRLPPGAFEVMSWATSVLTRRRQLTAVATKG